MDYHYGKEELSPDSEVDGNLLEPELFAKLNEEFAEDDGDLGDLPSNRRSVVMRVISLSALVAFIIYVMGSFFSYLAWPSLAFLQTSQVLKEEALIKQLQPAVVEIRALESFSSIRQRQGTGFNISPQGLIITNRHVIEDAAAVTVVFPSGETFVVGNWQEHPVVDLAYTRIDAADLPWVPVKLDGMPAIDEEVTIIGNPLGFPLVAMRGRVSAYGHLDESLGVIMEVQAPIHQGSSGSPVFDPQGQVVAVIFATLSGDGPENDRGLAIPIVRLQDFWHD